MHCRTCLRIPFLVFTLCVLACQTRAQSNAPRAFSFLHTYESTGRYWKGIQKAGLIRPTTGIRLVNSPFGEDAYRFNATAAADSPLHRILQDARCGFIIDRVVGGSPFRPYDFDQSLIRRYGGMLGDKFLGGQVHEVISNVHNDWGRLKKAMGDHAADRVDPAAVRAYFDWSCADKWLEYGTVDDYAGRETPKTDAEYWTEIQHAVRRQADRFAGRFSYCEGTHYGELVWTWFYEWGAASCLVEVGPWASRDSQFAIASVRGAARIAGKPWGIFYAPWGPDGCTSYVNPAEWSWHAPKESLDASGWPVGPDKGPSTALQRRIFFHAYLSGAHTLHEEWGAEGNLLDWDNGTLSPYGQVTKELLDFQDRHPDVGEPYTPIGVVLDTSAAPPDPAPWTELKKKLFAYGPEDERCAARNTGGKAEAVCYSPCTLPEIFDIVPLASSPTPKSPYSLLIPVEPPDAAWTRLDAAVRERCPFTWQTHMPKQINRRQSDGAWLIALHNPWGAVRGDVHGIGSLLDDGCAIQERLEFKTAPKSVNTLYRWPDNSRATLDGNILTATVGPGGILVLECQNQSSRQGT